MEFYAMSASPAKKDWMVRESELEKDDYEYKVLHATLDKSCIVSGCAGSGKSVLALIKAQRIQLEKGNNYQIVVFTKALCSYMNAGRRSLGLNNPFTYLWRFQAAGCPSTDNLIVDEIQDFDEKEINQFVNAANKHFFFFGDSAQSVYDGIKQDDGTIKRTVRVEDLCKLSSIKNLDYELFTLVHNYRLPLPVARVANYIGVNLPPFDATVYKSAQNVKPYIIKYDDTDKQIEAIVRIIRDKSLSDVGIFVQTNQDVDTVSQLLNRFGVSHQLKSKTNENLDFSNSLPKVMTYNSAKGLQFDTVFLPFVQDIFGNTEYAQNKRRLLYVAMTRTYRNLYVMYSGNMPMQFIGVPRGYYSTDEIEEVEDI